MNESFTKEQVLTAYNDAPALVRAAFNDEKTTELVIEFQKRFQLHVDKVGLLAKEVGYLLLGLTDSNKFSIHLKEGGFPDSTISEIANEINQKIFSQIRKEEIKESVAEKEVVQSALAAAESHAAEEVPRAIHHELPQVVRKVPVVPAIEVPASAPVASVPKPLQSLPRIIVPIPTTPPRPLESRPVFPAPQTTSESPVPTVPPTPIKSYSVDPYREPIE